MPQLDVFHVVEDGVQALSLVDHLVGRDENELRIPVDEFLDQPRAGDPVDLDVLARDPFHAILQFAGRRGRNRAAGKASFLHPGLVFLSPDLRRTSTENPLRTVPAMTGCAKWAWIR